MAQTTYSFLDVAALDEVRARFAAGDALAILSADLEDVIWANGPGAALFGHADVETIFGAPTPLGPAARRQIAAIRGFPDIGRDKAVVVRPATGIFGEALRFLASAVVLPDGERGILLTQPAAEGMQHEALLRAVGGFAQPGHFVAFADAAGAVEAASPGFERLGLAAETLAGLAGETSERRRIVTTRLDGRRARLPVGIARLTENRFLLVVIDENWADLEPAGTGEAQVDTGHEVWHLGSAPAADEADETDHDAVQAEAAALDAVAAEAPMPEAIVAEGPAPEPGNVDAGGAVEEAPSEDAAQEPVAEIVVETAQPQTPPAGLATGPVRFVWRTDAEGRFSQVSPEFARAVGDIAADVVGRRYLDVANAFGLDPKGDIAGLLQRRDTWSGRSVSWPIAGTDLRVPVDLAALPVYDRNRTFEGFRGFGVARCGDAFADPDGPGLTLARLPSGDEADAGVAETAQATAETAPQAADLAAEAAPTQKMADPAEKPALEQTPGHNPSDKVIRLAEHRHAASERGPAEAGGRVLSNVERLAFRQIGERLKQDSGGSKAVGEPAEGRAETHMPAAELPHDPNPDTDEETVAELRALDGASEDEAKAGETEAGPRRRARPGMSLLDFAEWGSDDPNAADAPPQAPPAASVELDEAAALDERLATVETAAPDEIAGSAAVAEGADDDATASDAGDAAPIDAGPEDQAAATASDTQPDELAGDQPALAREAARAEVQSTEASVSGGMDGRHGSGLSILEKLPVPVLVHSGDMLHYANGEFFALTGYGSVAALAEAGGIGALFADPYEDDAGAQDELPQRRPDRHLRLRTQGGDEFPVEAFLQSVPWESGKALVLVLSRVREGGGGQSPLIAELEARVAEMRTIIDTATDGVVLIARDGNIRSISRPAEALFGIDSDEVAGKPFASLFAIESQKAARDYLAGLSEHGVASVLNDGREVIGREAQGRFIPLFMTIGRLPGDSGYCAVVRDITQWKRAEEELTQARATAERASSHKSDFLARVSHEIRTPLNAIIGFSELMLDEKFGPVANDRYRDYLRDINRSGSHVLDLVNDLLDISKIEAGQQEMNYEAVSLNETLAETVAMMQPQANRERVIIRSSFASKLPDVVADLRSVRQIALNVLSNAVRYTQAGGQVIVSTAYEADGEVVLRVRDTGIGMTPAEIEQALKPFKQINSLKRTRGDGTGLGLPLTKAMVEANRAKFSIHSTPGEGTLVEVAFPPTRVLAE
ncbi:PAS domain-containing sensor histidine kinase [Mesorhizobium sp. ZMM04-5]|uniref:histidine kinase n=1 Tax=Mesorhizobium marinum TaxID=3228790 RepID=A0ABV3R339_9HYPH